MQTVKVTGTWVRDGKRARGQYKIIIPSRLEVDGDEVLVPKGVWKSGHLTIFKNSPSLSVDVPRNDVSEISPKNFPVYIEITFSDDNSKETYQISTNSSTPIDLEDETNISDLPDGALLGRGVPGGYAGLDNDGDVIDAEGIKILPGGSGGGGGGGGSDARLDSVLTTSKYFPYTQYPQYYYALAPDTEGDPYYLGPYASYLATLTQALGSFGSNLNKLDGKFPNPIHLAAGGGASGTLLITAPVVASLTVGPGAVLIYQDGSGLDSKLTILDGLEHLLFSPKPETILSSWTGGPAVVTLNGTTITVENAPQVYTPDPGFMPHETLLGVLDIPQVAALPPTNWTGGPIDGLTSGQDSFTLGPSFMHQPMNRTLVLGCLGDYSANTGPTDVIAIDPYTAEIVTLYPQWDTERIDHWRTFSDETVWATSIDPRGSGPASLMTNWSEDHEFRRIEIDVPGKRLVHCWDVISRPDNSVLILGTRDLTSDELTTSGYPTGVDSSAICVWKLTKNNDFSTSVEEIYVEWSDEPNGYNRATSWASISGYIFCHSMKKGVKLIDDGEGQYESEVNCFLMFEPGSDVPKRKTISRQGASLANELTRYPTISGINQFFVEVAQNVVGFALTSDEDAPGEYTLIYDTGALLEPNTGRISQPLDFHPTGRYVVVTSDAVVQYTQPSGGLGGIGKVSQFDQTNGSRYGVSASPPDPNNPNSTSNVYLFTGGHTIYRSGYPSNLPGLVQPIAGGAEVLLLEANQTDANIPGDTPPGTLIFRKAPEDQSD